MRQAPARATQRLTVRPNLSRQGNNSSYQKRTPELTYQLCLVILQHDPRYTRPNNTLVFGSRQYSTAMPVRINIPPVTRAVLGALVLQSFLSAAIRYRQWTSSTSEIVIPYLTLVPQLSLFYPWTFVTTTLVENNIFTIAIAGATLYYGCRYLERAWSSAELAKFLVITALIPNLLTLVVLVVLFNLSRNEHWT